MVRKNRLPLLSLLLSPQIFRLIFPTFHRVKRQRERPPTKKNPKKRAAEKRKTRDSKIFLFVVGALFFFTSSSLSGRSGGKREKSIIARIFLPRGLDKMTIPIPDRRANDTEMGEASLTNGFGSLIAAGSPWRRVVR